MVKVSIIVCVLALWAFAGVNCATKSAAPAPSVDCSTIIFTMADCLTFVTNGSKITKPEGGCCSGLKTVLKTDAQCLCQAFANSGSLGIALDMKKALTLPKACGVSAPSFSNCNLPGVPGASPASAPKSSAPPSSTPVSPAATPEASSGGSGTTGNIMSPAPAPSHAASSSSVSFVALIASLVVVSSCSYLF